MILVQPLSAPRAANALEVEQRCYLIIVAIFLAQGLLLAEPFVHGFEWLRVPRPDAQKGVLIRHSLPKHRVEVLINTSPGRLDRVTGG